MKFKTVSIFVYEPDFPHESPMIENELLSELAQDSWLKDERLEAQVFFYSNDMDSWHLIEEAFERSDIILFFLGDTYNSIPFEGQGEMVEEIFEESGLVRDGRLDLERAFSLMPLMVPGRPKSCYYYIKNSEAHRYPVSFNKSSKKDEWSQMRELAKTLNFDFPDRVRYYSLNTENDEALKDSLNALKDQMLKDLCGDQLDQVWMSYEINFCAVNQMENPLNFPGLARALYLCAKEFMYREEFEDAADMIQDSVFYQKESERLFKEFGQTDSTSEIFKPLLRRLFMDIYFANEEGAYIFQDLLALEDEGEEWFEDNKWEIKANVETNAGILSTE